MTRSHKPLQSKLPTARTSPIVSSNVFSIIGRILVKLLQIVRLYASQLCGHRRKKTNPDPRNYVPVHGVGFEALQTRNKEADKAVEEFTKILQGIKTKLDEMKQLQMQHTFKIEQLRREHCTLSNRLLKVMSTVEIDRARGYGLMIQEVDFHKKLQQMDRRLEKPGQFRSKVKEMESLVSREGGEGALDSGLAVDQNSSKDLFEFLQTQKEAIGQLTMIVQQDLPVVSTIGDGLKTELKANAQTARQ